MKKNYIIETAEALSNMTMWGVVKSLMESSLLYGGHCQRAEEKVIKIATNEMHKEFRRYEKTRVQVGK